MFESFLNDKESERKAIEKIVKELDIRYVELAMEMEKLKKLSEKIDKIDEKLRGLDDIISAGGMKLEPRTKSVKTKDAIKLILKKHGELTSSQLGKLIKLSRTRCNEYLREMEEDGITISRMEGRKKLYKLRH